MNKSYLIEIGQHTYLGIFNQNKEKVIYLTQNETIVNQVTWVEYIWWQSLSASLVNAHYLCFTTTYKWSKMQQHYEVKINKKKRENYTKYALT
jgi:hypothetical protein